MSIPRWTVLFLVLWTLPAQAREAPVTFAMAAHDSLGTRDRIELAESWVGLVRDGFHGVELTRLPVEPLAAPFVILDSLDGTTMAARVRQVGYRACIHAAAVLHLRGILEAPDGDGTAWLADQVAACRKLARAEEVNSRAFCLAARLQVIGAHLPPALRPEVEKRCGPRLLQMERLEAAVAAILQGSVTREPADGFPEVADSDDVSWFGRAYRRQLVAQARQRLRAGHDARACRAQGDCGKCLRAARRLLESGQEERAAPYVTLLNEQPDGRCARQEAILAAWRQDWETLEQVLTALPDPQPAWADELFLYRQCRRLAGGDADPAHLQQALETVAKLERNAADKRLLDLTVRALYRLAATLAGQQTAATQREWLLELAQEEQVRALGDAALALLLIMGNALGTTADVVNLMDRFLSGKEGAADCGSVSRAARELLALAMRESDADRLQQARVLFERLHLVCNRDLSTVLEAQAFQVFAAWADLNLASRPVAALEKLRSRSQDLVLRLPDDYEPSLRSMVLLNLLAASVATRKGSLPDLESFLVQVSDRNVAHHALWIHYLVQQRATARAFAVSRLCAWQAAGESDEVVCLLWEAALHELSGRRDAARVLLDEVQTRTDTPAGDLLRDGVLFHLAGERNVRLSTDWKGRLHLSTGFEPRFYLNLLPSRSYFQRQKR